MINPWKILGVHRKSTDDDIRDAYISLAKIYHPDKDRKLSYAMDKFVAVNSAYQFIKNKIVRNANIGHLKIECDECAKCRGTGVISKSKGLTGKEYTACKGCGGSGFIIEERNDEQGTIELRGTDGTGGKRRNKKR